MHDFRVAPGAVVDLKRWPTTGSPDLGSKRDSKLTLAHHVDRLQKLQELLYASHRHAVLVVFQGMDTAGKDGCIKHVMSGVNPQGCNVFSYSHPTPTELRHDFLWRTTRDLPERGMIGIFNRSYYEEVLIVRVHPEILQAEAIPGNGQDEKIWADRYRSIIGLERHLHANGTRIIKIFLHISKEEQKKRLLERIDTPEKNWKITAADIAERAYWPHYLKAYDSCLSATSTREAPWHVVPADDKHAARLFVSQIVLETLESLDLKRPDASPDQKRALQAMRAQLEAD